jgi:hypothetical protein
LRRFRLCGAYILKYDPQKLEKMDPDVKQKDESVPVSRVPAIGHN